MFIKLTRSAYDVDYRESPPVYDASRSAIWVNTMHLAAMSTITIVGDIKVTELILGANHYCNVEETPDQIRAMMEGPLPPDMRTEARL